MEKFASAPIHIYTKHVCFLTFTISITNLK